MHRRASQIFSNYATLCSGDNLTHPRIRMRARRGRHRAAPGLGADIIISAAHHRAEFPSHLTYRNSNDLRSGRSFVCRRRRGDYPAISLPRREPIALIEIYSWPRTRSGCPMPSNPIRLMNKRSDCPGCLVMYAPALMRSRLPDRGTRSSIIDLAGSVPAGYGRRLCHFDNWPRLYIQLRTLQTSAIDPLIGSWRLRHALESRSNYAAFEFN